jgi:putative hemolysin
MRATVEPGVTEQDIRAMVEQGAEAGALQPEEHEIVENTFRLGDRSVATIMTPRPDVAWIDANATPSELRAQLVEARWSPYLVCDGDADHVLGLVTAEDLLLRSLGGGPIDLRSDLRGVLREPLFVPATMPVLGLLRQFRSTRRHAAVALDEFGGVMGLVTIDDILEALVGALPEPDDETPPEIARQTDGSWLVDGAAAVTDVMAAVGVDLPEHETRRGFDTVGGLVMSVLGRLPTVGDAFDYGTARFTVEGMDGRRIASVRVRLLDDHPASDRAGQPSVD